MAKLMVMGFKERFGVKPPVTYIEDTELKKRYRSKFKALYSKCLRKRKKKLSKTRAQKFEAYFRNLERAGSDLDYCKRVSLRYISAKVGYGVFAKEAIPPYSTLIHYVGEMVPTETLKVAHDSTFSFEHFQEFSIDAMKRGNWARFMNHADVCTPHNNVVVWEYYTKDGPYIIFTSGPRGIKKGAQLLYSYGDEYWEDRKSLKLK